MEYYGITDEILDSWIEGSGIEKSDTGAYLTRTDNELRAFAIQELTEKLPDEQGAFFNIDEAAEFYDLGCQAAELTIVQDWRRDHCPPATWKMFKKFNKLLKKDAPIEKIRSLLSHVPEGAKPVMELLLECAEVMKKTDVLKKYLDSMNAEPAQTDEVQTLSKQIIEQNREAYKSLASSDKERPE